jgi:spermidine/putrescine transport system permease protein
VICLVVGYTVAYFTARSATKYKGLILLMLVSPLWISYLMRIYAWQGLLESGGPINFLLRPVGFGDTNWLQGMHITVILGLVYGYIPFMILPIFASLIGSGEHARGDAIWREWTADNWRVTAPVAPAILADRDRHAADFGDYYTNDLLGSTKTSMFGNLISTQREQQGGSTRMASLVLILAVLVLVPMLYYLREIKRAAEQA